METFATLSETLARLKNRGYTIDFNRVVKSLPDKKAVVLPPDRFRISDVYRFDGETNPDDEAVVYAIESREGEKGVLVNSYGVYADPGNDEIIRKLAVQYAG